MNEPTELSIAIATHTGRSPQLRRLLESIGSSFERSGEDPNVLDVSIHDNASSDDTASMVAEMASALPFRVSYARFPENRGLTQNLIAAMRNARGRHAWTVGSDDLIAPDGIGTVLAALRRAPELTGLIVNSIDVDPGDDSLRSRQPTRAFFPDPDSFTVFTDLDQVLEQCGNAWCSLSWTVQHRERWLASVAKREQMMEANPVFPQLVAEAGAALDDPRWGWEPTVAVHRRGAETFVFESGPVPLARKWAELLGPCCDAWAEVLGGRNRRWRRRVAKLQLVWGRAEDVRAAKLYERPSLPDQLRLAWSWTRSLWPTRAYWREVLPALASPAWLTRRLHGYDRPPSAAPATDRPLLRLTATVPSRLEAGTAPIVKVRVENAGRRIVRGTGPSAVGVWQRWHRAEGGAAIGWGELGVNDVGSQPVDLGRRLLPRSSANLEIALMPPREPGTYEVTLAAHQHGVGWLDTPGAGAAASIKTTVEVT